jgi:hypothetical protein
MTQSNRKLIGVLLLVGSIAIWSVLATALYLGLLMEQPWWIHITYFAVAGSGWLLPAMWIVRWMSAPDP